jgi:uncharacterized membrane protein required for colicin V production
MLAAASYTVPDGLKHLNWVDYTFLVVLIYSALSGAWIGFMAECVSLAGVAAGTFVAGLTYHDVGKWLSNISVPENSRDWVGFIAVFVVISLVFRLASVKARKLSKVMVQGIANELAGGLLGLIVGAFICLFAFVAVGFFHDPKDKGNAQFIDKLYSPLVNSQIVINSKNLEQEFVTLLPTKMHTIKGFTTN